MEQNWKISSSFGIFLPVFFHFSSKLEEKWKFVQLCLDESKPGSCVLFAPTLCVGIAIGI